MTNADDGADAKDRERLHAMSHRKQMVLELVAVGLGNDQIARRMHLSTQAIAYHVSRLMAQFRAGNRASLVAKAYHHRVLAPEDWPPRVGGSNDCPATFRVIRPDDSRSAEDLPSSGGVCALGLPSDDVSGSAARTSDQPAPPRVLAVRQVLGSSATASLTVSQGGLLEISVARTTGGQRR